MRTTAAPIASLLGMVLFACSSSNIVGGGPDDGTGAGDDAATTPHDTVGDDDAGALTGDGGSPSASDGAVSQVGKDGSATPADAAAATRTSTRLSGSNDACDVVAGNAGAFFVTTMELRAVVDASAGTTRLVANVPPGAIGCGRLALTASTVYLAVSVAGGRGQLYSVPVGGGTFALVGDIPGGTPGIADVYPVVTDGSDVFVAASPNVWHLPATGSGALTKLAIGSSNFYANGLALGPSALYTYESSPESVVRIPKTGGATTSQTGLAELDAFVVAGDALYGAVHYPTTTTIERFSLDLASPGVTFAPHAANALASDGTNLYADEIDPTPSGSAIVSHSVAVYALATGALVTRWSTTATPPSSPTIAYAAELVPPLAVDGAYVYVHENDYGSVLAVPK